MTEIDLIRTNNAIDPHVHIWGWEIPVYLFLGGLAAGVMILTALLRLIKTEAPSRSLRLLPFSAPILLSLGMGALFVDLAYKLHVYRFYLAFQIQSPMSWGAWILLLIYPATLLLGVLGMEDAEWTMVHSWAGKLPERFRSVANSSLAGLKDFARQHERKIVYSNIVLGIALGIYTGILLSSLGRLAWNSAVLGPLFLASGISAGSAFMLLLPLSDTEHHTVKRWDMLAITAEALLIGLYLIGLHSIGTSSGQLAADLFMGGPYTLAFWILVGGMGLALPLAIEVSESAGWLRHSAVTAALAPVLILAGGLSLRWILVMAGQG